MTAKLGALVLLALLLSAVHFGIQPRIEWLLGELPPEGPPPEGLAPKLARLRMIRKRISAVCPSWS